MKHYIKLVEVYVYSHFDIIKRMLSKPILHSRIGKWALALTEYSLTYFTLKALKGQIITDFIVDHSVVETMRAYVGIIPWKLYFDSFKHKDGSGVGIYILSPDNMLIKFICKIPGACSNNEVEYEALITGLQFLLDLGETEVELRGNSELEIQKLKKEYKFIKENLILYFFIANRLSKLFNHVLVDHIP